MRAIISAAAAAALAIGLGATANAATYTWSLPGPATVGNQTAGSYQALNFTFYDGANAADSVVSDPTLSVGGTVTLNTDVGMIGGGWFALTPGGDPRATDDQIAIFYMDFTSGRISAYRYDGTLGVNGMNTYQDSDLFIASWANAVTTTLVGDTLSFEIDDLNVSAVQNAVDSEGYTGVSFDDQIGIWLHLSVMREIGFFDDGQVATFRPGALASFDLPIDDAGAVPLPGAALLLLTGIAGLAGARRIKR